MSLVSPPGLEFAHEANTLVALLRDRAVRFPRQRAFTFLLDGDNQRRHINYDQLDRLARLIAVDLQSRGLEGERALLLYPSGLEFIAAFFGCLYAGVVAVPAYPPRRNRNLTRIQSIVSDATPKIALTTRDVYARVAPMIEDMPDLRAMPWRTTDDFEQDNAANAMANPAVDADAWRPPNIDGSTLAFLQYTSGSTGTPKGVMLSHGNLLHNTAIISAGFRPSHAGEAVTWLPLYHDMGLIGGIIQPIYFALPTNVMAPAHFLQKPIRWLRAMSDTGAMISGGPNFAYDLCVDRVTEEEKASLDLSQWELAFNGAEPVRPETMARFAKAFAPCGFQAEAFYPCYGLAEATLMVTGGIKETDPLVHRFDTDALKDRRGVISDKPGSISIVSSGTSLLDQEVVIVDPDTVDGNAQGGKPVADGSIGEIWVSGPSVAQGYWQKVEQSQQTFSAKLADGRGPFLRTGDLGFLCEGELFIAGRLKDLIIIRGANHYPQDIEMTVNRSHRSLHAAAGAAVAIGEAGAEQLVIIQEMPRARNLPFEEMFDAIRSEVTQMHDVAPVAVVLIKPNSIPKTSSGKIQRNATRQAYLDGELSVVADWSVESGLNLHRKRGTKRDASRNNQPTAVKPHATNGHAKAAAAPIANEANNVELVSTVDRVLAIVRGIAKERATNLSLDTDIAGMGLDSLERMEIVANLEDSFGGRFPEEAIMGMETCRDVVAAVESHLDGASNAVATKATPKTRQLQPGDYQFAESSEYKKLQQNFALVESLGVGNPYFTQHQGVTNDTTLIGGREYINWCSYNYLGMSGDPEVERATQDAIAKFGTSVSASRLVSGEKTLHRDLEQAIARFIGTEDAIVLVGGHATNETVIGHLFGPGDLILHDALSHNSIVQGVKLSGAQRRAFPHNDAAACAQLLERYRDEYRRVLIVVEGVYSMDGDSSPVPEFVALKQKHKAYLMVDEAHSIGTMGKTGRGMSEHCGVDPRDVDIWMGTMSKSLGSCGGYIAASKEIVEYLKYTAPGFVYSVGLSPPNAAACLKSLQLIEAEPERIAKLAANSKLFLSLAKAAGLNTGMSNGSPVVPIITGNSLLALKLSKALFERGINVQPIMYPAVEEAAARLRFFITSLHTEKQIRLTIKLLEAAWAKLQEGETAEVIEFTTTGGTVQQAAAKG